jgi:hypothetical protein
MTCPEYTPTEFKDYFYRDFTYIDTYVSGSYSTGDVVFYETTKKVYRSTADSNTEPPTDETKWDVVPWSEVKGQIVKEDIEKAYDQSCTIFNETLFDNDTELQIAYFYLTAHFLVMDGKMGGSKSDGNKVTNKSVGNVSIGYTTATWIANNDQFGFLSQTKYGQKYLAMLQGRNVGKVLTVEGAVNA